MGLNLKGLQKFCDHPAILISLYIFLGIVALMGMMVIIDVIVHTPQVNNLLQLQIGF
jgi:hypothetical protein